MLLSCNRFITAASSLAHFLLGFGSPILQMNLQGFTMEVSYMLIVRVICLTVKSKPENNEGCQNKIWAI